MRGKMECYGFSDKGKVRDSNDDQFLIADVNAKEACHRLVDAGNEAGGTDNITVVIARFRDLNEQEDAFEAEVGLDEVIAGTGADTETTTLTADNVPETELVREGLGESPNSTA